jgi:predicted DNA repair protein MutK
MWFTEDAGNNIGRITGAGAITEFPTPTSGRAAGITTGPDGNLWFVEATANKIVKVQVAVSLSPSPRTFPTQGLLSPSAPRTVTVRNNQNTTLTFSGVTIAGANPGDFTQSATTCVATLAAKASCTISIQFVPQATGARIATLLVSDDAGPSPQTVALTGTGVPPVTAAPATLGFGSQGLGSPTAAKTVTVNSNVSAVLTFSSITIAGANAGDFTLSATTCVATLAAQASCTISIQFAPLAAGSRTATLTVSDDAASSPQTVSLTGTGK